MTSGNEDLVTRSGNATRLQATPHEPRAVARQHAKGKLTARERIDLLAGGSRFVEFGSASPVHPNHLR